MNWTQITFRRKFTSENFTPAFSLTLQLRHINNLRNWRGNCCDLAAGGRARGFLRRLPQYLPARVGGPRPSAGMSTAVDWRIRELQGLRLH
jgi:hypothetical protein